LEPQENFLLIQEKQLEKIDERLKMNDWHKTSSLKIAEQQLRIVNKKN
jgi:hypothetical protein